MEKIKITFILFAMFANLNIRAQGMKGDTGENQQKVYAFNNISTENWSTCEEFLANTTFDPNTVIDVDWKVFYYWHFSTEDTYIMRFSLPYPVLVDRFRIELQDLKPPVNWTNAAMFMETSADFSALFIKTEKPSTFRIIPNLAFKYDVPTPEFAFKLVYPGYLGIMNCKYRYCYGLAPFDDMPTEENVHEEALKLGFRGDYNRSYLFDKHPNLPVFEDDDIDHDPIDLYDDDDDVD